MKSSLITGSTYLTLTSFFFITSGYIINLILGRTLGPEIYGIYGVVLSIMNLINLTQTSAIPPAVSKYVAGSNKDSESVLKSALIIQGSFAIILTIIFIVCIPFITSILEDNSLTSYLQFCALIIPINSIYSVYLGYYSGLHYFKKQALMEFIYAFTKIFFTISLVSLIGIYGAFTGLILAPLLGLIVSVKLPNFRTENYSFKKIISFSLPALLITFFAISQQTIDLLFVKIFSQTDVQVGYYTASQNIARIPLFGINALNSVIFAGIASNIYLKDKDNTKHILQSSLRVLNLILLPIVIIISFFSKEILTLLYSSKYSEASQTLSILIFSTCFLTISSLLSSVLSASGKLKIIIFTNLVGILATSTLCYFLIPSYGIIGAAFSSVIGSLIILSIMAIVTLQQFNTLIKLRNLANILFAALVISFTLYEINVNKQLLPGYIILVVIVYIGTLILLKELNKSDYYQFRKLFIKNWRDKNAKSN